MTPKDNLERFQKNAKNCIEDALRHRGSYAYSLSGPLWDSFSKYDQDLFISDLNGYFINNGWQTSVETGHLYVSSNQAEINKLKVAVCRDKYLFVAFHFFSIFAILVLFACFVIFFTNI